MKLSKAQMEILRKLAEGEALCSSLGGMWWWRGSLAKVIHEGACGSLRDKGLIYIARKSGPAVNIHELTDKAKTLLAELKEGEGR